MRAGLSGRRKSGYRAFLSLAGASALAFAGTVPALAQGYGYDPMQERWVRRQSARPAEAASARRELRPEDMLTAREAQGPMMAVVSLNDQRVTIYDAQGRLARAPVSSGTTGHETPVGLYTIIQKNRDHVSNLYDAEMPFMQRITWSGIALHAGVIPGYPASHGCVRLPTKFAETLFDMTNRGMRVVLVRADISPVAFSHPALFKPTAQQVALSQPATDGQKPMHLGAPPASGSAFEALKAEAEAKAKAAEEAGRKADAARALAYRLNSEFARDARYVRGAEYIKGNLEVQLRYAEQQLANAPHPAARDRAQVAIDNARRKLDEAEARLQSIGGSNRQQAVEQARQDAVDAESARKKAVEEAAIAQRKLLPISVLVSRATQRIYVRQANEPVMDMPVTIRDPEKPIGTTLFTAIAHEGNDVRWTALQMYVKGTEPDLNAPANARGQARRFLVKSPEPVPSNADEAKAVLDRIDIPEEARVRISEVVAPGSSLIVSDEPMHKETGGGTDFIVLMPGEPQGGIRMSTKPTRDRGFDDDDDRPRRRRRGGWDDNPWW